MNNHNLTIINGHIIDPANNIDDKLNIIIEHGKISKITKDTYEVSLGFIDAAGLIVTPGFIDLHTHLREPGFEDKEDIESGSHAATAGGFATILCMPNTDPVNDNADVTQYIIRKAQEVGLVKIYPVGAISKGLKGKELSDILKCSGGTIAISDDGKSIQDRGLMKKGMEVAKDLGLLIISHPEDKTAKNSRDAENIMIERDIELAGETGCRLHIAHVSTAEGIDMVRRAKEKGLPVTCEVTPHHITLTEKWLKDGKPNTTMNPPLRKGSDRKALIQGLIDKTVDAIATDHAPHEQPGERVITKLPPPNLPPQGRKAPLGPRPFTGGGRLRKGFIIGEGGIPPGVIGMETALPICMMLVENRLITLERLIELLTTGPAKVAGLKSGSLTKGMPADITIFDPETSFKIDSAKFKSKSSNTPFDGWEVKGRIVYTVVDGKIIYKCN